MTSPTNPTREAQPSATPRTDAAVEYAYARKLNMKEVADVIEDQAKQFETELQQANARERDLKDELANTEHKNQAQGMEIAALASDLSETRAELARLKAGSGDTRLLEAQQLLRDLILQHRSVGTKLATQDVDDIEIVLDALRAQQAENASLKHEKEAAEDWSKSQAQLLANAQAENARLAAETSAFCEWSYNEDYSYFDGTCGAAWYFEHVSEDEVPSKTLRFCPSCGKQIKRVERTRSAGPADAGGGR